MQKIQTDIKTILSGAPQNFSQKGDAKQTRKVVARKNIEEEINEMVTERATKK